MLTSTSNRCYKITYNVINMINFFVFIVGIFTIINLENVKFREICQEGILLTYLLIFSNIMIPISISYCMVYIYYFTNDSNIIKYINILIQLLVIILGTIQALEYILNNDCINMTDNKYLTYTEKWWVELYNNTFILTMVLIYTYIVIFYCYYFL